MDGCTEHAGTDPDTHRCSRVTSVSENTYLYVFSNDEASDGDISVVDVMETYGND